MRGFKSIFVSSKHKINYFLIQEKYFQTANAVDTLPLIRHCLGQKLPLPNIRNSSKSVSTKDMKFGMPSYTSILYRLRKKMVDFI